MPTANEIAIYTSLANNRTPGDLGRPSQAALTTNSFKGFVKYTTKQEVRTSRAAHCGAASTAEPTEPGPVQAPEIPHNIDDFAGGSVRQTCEGSWEYYVAKASTRRHRAIAARIETCRRLLLQTQASALSH